VAVIAHRPAVTPARATTAARADWRPRGTVQADSQRLGGGRQPDEQPGDTRANGVGSSHFAHCNSHPPTRRNELIERDICAAADYSQNREPRDAHDGSGTVRASRAYRAHHFQLSRRFGPASFARRVRRDVDGWPVAPFAQLSRVRITQNMKSIAAVIRD
jgi:hypothetical protein